MKLNKILSLVVFTFLLISCNNDDDGTDIEFRLLSEVAVEDDAEIQEFLATHFYNYEDFDNPSADFDYKIVIDTIEGDNADKTPLLQSPNLFSEVIEVDSDDFGLDDEEIAVEHTLYYIIANKGDNDMGLQPTPLDSTYLIYEGTLLDNTVFDRADIPVWFDMLSTVRGFGTGMSKFKTGGEVDESAGDGTFTVLDPGAGIIIMPSGLGYFAGTAPGEAYAPIIFNVNLYRMEESDHDRDGVPTWIEDINKDFRPLNDDTDGDGIPDYLDTDDDGDNILTNDEIRDEDGEIAIDYPDADNDDTPDYLDPDTN